MKKFIFSSILWLTSVVAHSQFTDPFTIANTDYLELSKKQKKTGWIALGAGAVLITTAHFISTEISYDYFDFEDLAGDLAITGLLCMTGGIHSLIISSKNKRKAINLSLKKETGLQLKKNRFSYAAIPALTLKISL